MRSGLAPMKAKAKMLQSHRDLILNYFRAKKEYSSGVVEGLNTKVKLVTRKSYGYRMAATIKIALIHALGRLPEPKSPTDLPEEPLCCFPCKTLDEVQSDHLGPRPSRRIR